MAVGVPVLVALSAGVPAHPKAVSTRAASSQRIAATRGCMTSMVRDSVWELCPEEPRARFLPAGNDQWLAMPALDDLLPWSGSGFMHGRTWVSAPNPDVLTWSPRLLTD